jgi:hypothetical protein
MSSTSNASFSCCFWDIAETARETLLDIKILYIINIYYFLLLVDLRIKKEPVAICDQVPLASLWDTFHFLHHQLLCVTSEKTQDYYTIKYTFPFCHKVSIWIFLICQNLWEFPACSAEAFLPVLWGMIPNVGLS